MPPQDRRRFRASFRRAFGCAFWRLGCRQSSFRHITRVPQRAAPYAWARPLVSWHAIVPFTFRLQVSHRTQECSSRFLLAPQGIRQSASWRRSLPNFVAARAAVPDLEARPFGTRPFLPGATDWRWSRFRPDCHPYVQDQRNRDLTAIFGHQVPISTIMRPPGCVWAPETAVWLHSVIPQW